MNIDRILRPEQLPFYVPDFLATSINNLIDALERDDKDLDAYLDEVLGSARGVREEHDAWLRAYYVRWGWMKEEQEQ